MIGEEKSTVEIYFDGRIDKKPMRKHLFGGSELNPSVFTVNCEIVGRAYIWYRRQAD